MSGSYIVLCLVGFLIQLVFIKVESMKKDKIALALKTTAAVFFILAGCYGLPNCSYLHYGWVIVAGLVMGLFGDVFLNLQPLVKNGELMFVIGAVAFLIGHFFYLLALYPFPHGTIGISFVAAAIFTAVTLNWVYRRITVATGLKIFGVFYIGAVVLITIEAGFAYGLNPVNTGALLLSLGAGLFTASDIVLMFDAFGNKQKWMRTANLVLYYLGQLLIATSVQFWI